MSFQVAARTILQLGAELIGSDEIAFYELIKNAIDARSKRVGIDIVIRLTYQNYVVLREEITAEKKRLKKVTDEDLERLRGLIEDELILGSPSLKDFKQELSEADSIDVLLVLLDEANYIDIRDTGEGMSLADLQNVYLTIGTRSRYKQRRLVNKNGSNGENSLPILGEKGVGRLSAMRLGNRLFVKTSKRGEVNWNILKIDWNLFSHESDLSLEDIKVEPEIGESKEDKYESGTLIRISALMSHWNADKVRKIVDNEFSRLTDPFKPEDKYPIDVYLNGDFFPVPDFDQSIFKFAHATVEAKFEVNKNLKIDNPKAFRLHGTVKYRLRDVKKNFDFDTVNIKSFAKAESLTTLRSLGSFTMQAYWFNRQRFTLKEGVPNFQYVRRIVKDWGGGLKLYRDGFRVFPYGSEDDDWLNLDQKALASGGYKVSRRQIIGKVDISSIENQRLIDQTNRQGLRDNDEKHAFVKLLQHILETEMRVFLRNVDKNLYQKKQLDLDVIEERFEGEVKKAFRKVRELVEKIPAKERDEREIRLLNESFDKIRESMKEVRASAETYRQGSETAAHLAGIGLLVESLAHELNRATSNALATLKETNVENLSREVKGQFKSLEAQMKTLKKRLQILDPVGTPTRQRKETFDLITWLNEILAGHEAQFARHGINYSVKVIPEDATEWRVKAVKGMTVQIFENLINNSVYWLKEQSQISGTKLERTREPDKKDVNQIRQKEWVTIPDKTFSPRIEVVIDVDNREVEFTDNGPGISPEMSEEIFLPYVTTKASGEGKGLGLYISREIATYHDAELILSDTPTIHSKRLNTFVFRLADS